MGHQGRCVPDSETEQGVSENKAHARSARPEVGLGGGEHLRPEGGQPDGFVYLRTYIVVASLVIVRSRVVADVVVRLLGLIQSHLIHDTQR